MKKISDMLDSIAKSNGYQDKNVLLFEYGFGLWSRPPKHKKREIIPLIFKHIKNKNQ